MGSPLSSADAGPSNPELIRRLFGLAWRYRLRCLQVLGIQLILLTMGLFGLSFTGVGIDYIRRVVVHRDSDPHPRAVISFLHFSLPAEWHPMHVLAILGGLILVLAVCRAFLNYIYAVQVNILVQQKLVVDLRAEIYDKLQRLSFRFFDANTTGSIITRVTGDVQSVRMFVDQVLIQSVIMVISLTVYAIYMASLSPGLTAGLPRDDAGAPPPGRAFFPQDPAGVRREQEPRGEDGPVPGREHPGRRRRQGFRAGGREPREIRGRQLGHPHAAVQHLLAGEPVLADSRLPHADKHDRSPGLRRDAGRPRVAAPGRWASSSSRASSTSLQDR